MTPAEWAEVFDAGASAANRTTGVAWQLNFALRAMAEKCREIAGRGVR